MKNLNKQCFLCGVADCDGIILNGEKICKECEEKIVNTTILDPNYDDYKDKLRIILFK